jgi:hypothetical protein
MRSIRVGAAALLAGLILTQTPSAEGCGYGLPLSPVVRLLRADCVLLGKVTSIEERPVSALPAPKAPQAVEFRVAVLQVLRPIKGVEGLTHVRLGLMPYQTLKVGTEACFFLNEHFEEPFLVQAAAYDYDEFLGGAEMRGVQVQSLERWSRLLADPVAGLVASSSVDEIYLTARLVLAQREDERNRGKKPVPLSPEMKRWVFEGLAAGDWKKPAEDRILHPQRLFAQLGPNAANGWPDRQFASPEEFQQAAKQWLRENAGR